LKFARKLIFSISRLLIGIISLISLYLIVALILTLIPVNSSFNESREGTTVYVISNGVHINLIIPSINNQYDWTNQFDTKDSYKYIAFGWGDKDFYMNTPTWSDLKVFTALKAGFILTPSVIQVYRVKKAPSISKNTRKLNLSDEQLKILSDYIFHSFQLENGKIVELFPEINEYGSYRYYKAKGKYSLFFTCNNWANKGLKKAGVKNAIWAPFDKSVLYHLS